MALPRPDRPNHQIAPLSVNTLLQLIWAAQWESTTSSTLGSEDAVTLVRSQKVIVHCRATAHKASRRLWECQYREGWPDWPPPQSKYSLVQMLPVVLCFTSLILFQSSSGAACCFYCSFAFINMKSRVPLTQQWSMRFGLKTQSFSELLFCLTFAFLALS